MKKIVWIACLMAGLKVFGQDCQNYLFLHKNKIIEMSIYDKKGEVNGKHIYQVTDVANSGGATTASLASETFDKKGKSVAKANSTIRCEGGVMMVDMKMMMPQQQSQQFSNTEAKSDNVYMEYPTVLHVGDQLKDGTFNMEISNGGIQQTFSINISDRKVENKENITTSAGTWDCFKISFKSKFTMKVAGVNVPPINMEGVEWYAPGFGIIKTQNSSGGTAITSIR